MDDALIEAIIPSSAPTLLPSGAVVEMDIHNIGGLRRVYTWETADIAVVVFVYRGSSVVAQKIGLLQSKRLYPENNDVQDDDPVGFSYGLNRILLRDPNSRLAGLNGQYDFSQDSKYGALKAGSKQIAVMDHFNAAFGRLCTIFSTIRHRCQRPLVIPFGLICVTQRQKSVAGLSRPAE